MSAAGCRRRGRPPKVVPVEVLEEAMALRLLSEGGPWDVPSWRYIAARLSVARSTLVRHLYRVGYVARCPHGYGDITEAGRLAAERARTV